MSRYCNTMWWTLWKFTQWSIFSVR
jgi:hypothetical protein